MSYTLKPADLTSVTDPEMAFGTERLLPAVSDIPQEFQAGNLYTRLAEAIFFDVPLPTAQIEMLDGFDPGALNRAVRAHLRSFGPRHEHKIAGVGFMISKAAVLRLP